MRSWLGVTEGESDEALEAMWVLCGCDYLLDGAEHLGARGVARLLRLLLRSTPSGGRTAVGLVQRLRARMSQPGAAHQAALALQDGGCTGCAKCGHEKHPRRLCPHPDCAEVEGGRRCIPKDEGAECGCGFHASETDRFVARSLEKARSTGGFLPAFDKAVAAFRAERARAREAALVAQRSAGGGLLSWRHRPDVAALSVLLSRLGWSPDTVLGKTMPTLLQWDASHLGAPECILRPRSVRKECGEGGSHGVPSHYAFYVEWEAAAPGGGAEADRYLALVNDKSKKELRALRASLLREHSGELLAEFEDARAAKLAADAAAAARKADKARKAEKAVRGQMHMGSFFPVKAKPALSGGSSQEKSASGRPAEEEEEEADGDASDGSASSDMPHGWRGPPPSSPSKRASPRAGAAGAAGHTTPPKKLRPTTDATPARTPPPPTQSDLSRFLSGAGATPLTVPPPAAAAAAAAGPGAAAAVPRPPRNRSLWTTTGEGHLAAGQELVIDLTFSPEASQRTPTGAGLPQSQDDDVIILS